MSFRGEASTWAVLKRQFTTGGEFFLQTAGADTLIVVCHGFTADPSNVSSVAEAIRELVSRGEVLAPDLHIKNPFSAGKPQDIMSELEARLEAAWSAHGGYSRVILVGHSFGALAVRKVFVDALFAGREWAAHVERIILLAAMNRGWEFSHHLAIPTFIAWKVGSFIGRIQEICGIRPFIIWFRRGGPFITGNPAMTFSEAQRPRHVGFVFSSRLARRN